MAYDQYAAPALFARQGVLNDIAHRAAQGGDCPAPLRKLALKGIVGAFGRQEEPARPDERQAQLGQDVKGRDCARNGDIIILPFPFLRCKFLCAGGNGADGAAQLVRRTGDKIYAFSRAVKQCHVQIGPVQLQRQAGETGAGADVDDFFSGKIGGFEQEKAIQHMPHGDGVGLGDGCQVHDLVGLQQAGAETFQTGKGILVRGQLPRRKARTDNVGKTHFSPSLCDSRTISAPISAGETPEIRDACPSVRGRICCNFCRASVRKSEMDR